MGGKRGDRRQAIVAVATELFCAQGYSHTTMSMIASRLGGSKATLWAYFRSKEELFAASMEIVRAKGEELSPLLEDTDVDLTNVLQRFGCAYLRFVSSDHAMMVRRTIIGNHILFGNRDSGFLDPVRRMLAAYLLRKRAISAAPIDHDIAARNFLALVESRYLEPILFGLSPDCDETTAVKCSVDFLIRAYDWADR